MEVDMETLLINAIIQASKDAATMVNDNDFDRIIELRKLTEQVKGIKLVAEITGVLYKNGFSTACSHAINDYFVNATE